MCCSARPPISPMPRARAIACALALDARAEAIPPRMESARRAARRHAHWRPCGTGDRRQFRRRAPVRLHGLRRHDQRGRAAGGGQQAARHAHLRQRRRRRARGQISSAARSAISCCADAASRCACSSRCGRTSAPVAIPQPTSPPSSSSKRSIPPRCAAFAALVGERPADALAQYHLRRLLNGGGERGSKWRSSTRSTRHSRHPYA